MPNLSESNGFKQAISRIMNEMANRIDRRKSFFVEIEVKNVGSDKVQILIKVAEGFSFIVKEHIEIKSVV